MPERPNAPTAPELLLETESGSTVMTPGRDYHVGRDPLSDIVIDDARVSWHVAVDIEHAALLLASADGGATFADVCEAIAAAAHTTDDVAALITRLLAGWLRDGLFLRPADMAARPA